MISSIETTAAKGHAPIYQLKVVLLGSKNRKHPEHKTMKEWLGRAFDAAAFNLEKTNLWLRKLKWPHVTEAQLRKILMGRDDYHE